MLLVAALTAFGGLLVAAVVKYADNVLKTYATATAILLTCTISAIASRVPPSPGFVLGLSVVLVSMGLYNGVRLSDLGSILAWPSARRRRRRRENADALE